MKISKLFFLFFFVQLGYSQEVIETSIINCDSEYNPAFKQNRLLKKEVQEDTLNIEICLILNCCSNPSAQIDFTKDTLILEILDTSNMTCTCLCDFNINIKAKGVLDTNFTLLYKFRQGVYSDTTIKNSTIYQELKKLQNIYIFPTLDEINADYSFNQTNREGQKIGVWNTYQKHSKKVLTKTYYSLDNQGVSQIVWKVEYDDKEELIEICTNKSNKILSCIDFKSYMILIQD
jgi:predicted peptidase